VFLLAPPVCIEIARSSPGAGLPGFRFSPEGLHCYLLNPLLTLTVSPSPTGFFFFLLTLFVELLSLGQQTVFHLCKTAGFIFRYVEASKHYDLLGILDSFTRDSILTYVLCIFKRRLTVLCCSGTSGANRLYFSKTAPRRQKICG